MAKGRKSKTTFTIKNGNGVNFIHGEPAHAEARNRSNSKNSALSWIKRKLMLAVYVSALFWLVAPSILGFTPRQAVLWGSIDGIPTVLWEWYQDKVGLAQVTIDGVQASIDDIPVLTISVPASGGERATVFDNEWNVVIDGLVSDREYHLRDGTWTINIHGSVFNVSNERVLFYRADG